MKKTCICPKCESTRVGRLETVRDGRDHGFHNPRSLAQEKEGKGWLKSKAVRGLVEAYICTECGYFEEYVSDLAQIDWPALEGFTWHQPPSGETEGPFR